MAKNIITKGICLLLVLLVIIGGSVTVMAETITPKAPLPSSASGSKQYAGGTYTYNLQYINTKVQVGGTYTHESPNDSYLYCSAIGQYHDRTNIYDIVAGGIAGFYKTYQIYEYWDGAWSNFYIDGQQVGYLPIY